MIKSIIPSFSSRQCYSAVAIKGLVSLHLAFQLHGNNAIFRGHTFSFLEECPETVDDEGLKKWTLIKPHTRIMITKLTFQSILLALSMTYKLNRFLLFFTHPEEGADGMGKEQYGVDPVRPYTPSGIT